MTSSMIQRSNQEEATVQTAKSAAPPIEMEKSAGWYEMSARSNLIVR
jgi:hypothetical protein